MKIKAILFVASLAISSSALADNKAKTDKPATTQKEAQLSVDDQKVVSDLKHTNDMEIQMGKLAQSNGTAQVKKFGATLVKDHTANNKKLTALAKKKGLATIPEAAPMTEAEKQDHQKMMDGMAKLKTMKGAEFDREFLPMMIEGHDKTAGKITAAQAAVKDADLVTHLNETKPVVQRHADMARELSKKAISMK